MPQSAAAAAEAVVAVGALPFIRQLNGLDGLSPHGRACDLDYPHLPDFTDYRARDEDRSAVYAANTVSLGRIARYLCFKYFVFSQIIHRIKYIMP